MQPLFAVGFDSLFGPHLLILLVIGILLFGKRLPEVGRSLGKGIVEFKKGLKGLEDDIDSGGSSSQSDSRTDRTASAAATRAVDSAEVRRPGNASQDATPSVT